MAPQGRRGISVKGVGAIAAGSTIVAALLGAAGKRWRASLIGPHAGRDRHGSFEQWARSAFSSGKYHEAHLSAEIVHAAQRLYLIAERGDRLIAAIALVLELPLITRDPQIADAAGVECIWS
jgi:hypothetical protein